MRAFVDISFIIMSSDKLFRVVYGYIGKLSEVVSADKKQEALEELEKNPHYVTDYLDSDIITKEEAKPFALRNLEKNPHYVTDYLDSDIITKEEAKPFALRDLDTQPRNAGRYVTLGILTKEEAKPYAVKFLNAYPFGPIGEWFTSGILNFEEAKRYALSALKYRPSLVNEYLNRGLLTEEEAKPYALNHLAEHPGSEYTEIYLSRKLITAEEAKLFFSGDVDKIVKSMPNSFTHSSHQSVHEINLILGVMKKLNVDKISWQQFQEVHPSTNKKLENIFNTFNRGKIVTRDQCLKMLGNNTEQHTYGLSYDVYDNLSTQVFLRGKNQTVVKLHMPESLLSKLSPEARKRLDAIEPAHFKDSDPFGWVRVTRLGDKWFIDELQSDKNKYIGTVQHEIREALKSGSVSEGAQKDQAFVKEMQIFSNWHEVLLSALLEAARESGVHEIYMHTGDTKLEQVEDIHQNKARNLYDKLPERMMFNKNKVNLGNGEHELWHRVASYEF